MEEGQNSKMRAETEPRGVRKTDTKISRLSDTSSFNKEAKLLCSRKKLHAKESDDHALTSVMGILNVGFCFCTYVIKIIIKVG